MRPTRIPTKHCIASGIYSDEVFIMIIQKKALTVDAFEISAAASQLAKPYPDSFALKSLSICIFEVENSLYMAC